MPVALSIFFVLFLCTDPSSVRVISSGTGSTEEAAQRVACVNALREAAGTRISTVTGVSDMQDVWSRIAQFSDGYVISSRLLEDPVCQDGICRVKLEVEIAMAPLESDLSRLSELIGDPVVSVRAGDSSEISMQAARILKALVTRSGLQPTAGLENGSKPYEDITLVANASCDCFADMGVSICDLDLNVELIENTTEASLTFLTARGRGRSVISAQDAQRKAVLEATDQLGDTLRADLVAAWQDFLKHGQVFRVIIRDNRDPSKFQIVKEALQLVPGLRSINERQLTRDAAIVDVRFEGLAGELRSYLVAPLNHHGLAVVDMRGRRLEIDSISP